ncbi:MAG TPA: ABC transporter permease [Mycobacteriales bacterium]|jgi:ABC-2 type transport system permease protein|nr:ABC transporter permease [Mycobacteriales bacterium]
MTTLTYAASDSAAMIGRSVKHTVRNLESLLMSVILPVVLMLMFVYVFGGAIDPSGDYANYVVPGIILLCTGYGAASTAVDVARDMTEGVVDRFRSMPILSSAVLTGHVVASLARNTLATVLVIGVAFLTGFRPDAGVLEWLAVAGMLVLWVLALSWVAVCFGLIARTVEGANGFTFLVLFLPYLSSAFVPVETMRAGLRAVAANQPVTPITETLRGLLLGTPVGSYGWQALAWCAGLLLAAFAAATILFRRRTTS